MQAGQSLRSALERARKGDTVNVHAGTYVESLLYVPSGIRLISVDGPGKARIDGNGHADTIAFYDREDVVVDGFEIFNAGVNVVKIERSSDITFRNCKIHDAGDGDCFKATVGTRRITIEDCEIYNPGKHDGGERYEQNVDFIDTEEGVVRRCLLYHIDGKGHQIGYFKGGSRRCTFENNVILNAGGDSGDSPAWTLGQQTDSQYKNGDYECVDSVIRGNLFINCKRGAIGFYGCKGGYAYGNTLINAAPAFGFHRAGNDVSPAIDQVHIYKNAVLNPAGNLEDLFQSRDNMDGTLVHDYNLVWNGGKKIPGGFKEAHAATDPPQSVPEAQAQPSDGYRSLLERFSRLLPKGGDLTALLPRSVRPAPEAFAPPPAPVVLAPPSTASSPMPERAPAAPTLLAELPAPAEEAPACLPDEPDTFRRPAPVPAPRKPAIRRSSKAGNRPSTSRPRRRIASRTSPRTSSRVRARATARRR